LETFQNTRRKERTMPEGLTEWNMIETAGKENENTDSLREVNNGSKV